MAKYDIMFRGQSCASKIKTLCKKIPSCRKIQMLCAQPINSWEQIMKLRMQSSENGLHPVSCEHRSSSGGGQIHMCAHVIILWHPYVPHTSYYPVGARSILRSRVNVLWERDSYTEPQKSPELWRETNPAR